MTYYTEPVHDLTARTTATSAAEGRLKVGMSRKKKRKIVRDKLNGMGGCGKKKIGY